MSLCARVQQRKKERERERKEGKGSEEAAVREKKRERERENRDDRMKGAQRDRRECCVMSEGNTTRGTTSSFHNCSGDNGWELWGTRFYRSVEWIAWKLL